MCKRQMYDIAVIIPCYNEETTIWQVIKDFQVYLPEGKIFVFDNNSTDWTAMIARKAGAAVIKSPIQGKGAVIRHALQVIDANVYLFVDGDATYPAKYARKLCSLARGRNRMVIGDRLSGNYSRIESRLFHDAGNKLVRELVNLFWYGRVPDIMTGYRAISSDFRQYLMQHLTMDGFETETEMTICALEHRTRIISVSIVYGQRPNGSASKLHTYSDGIKILRLICRKAME